MQCHCQQNGSLVERGAKLPLSTCAWLFCSRPGFISSSRLCMPAASGPVLSSFRAVTSFKYYPEKRIVSSEYEVPELSESPNSSNAPSRRTFLESTVDKNGYLCSPRAARELAFSILYAALLLDKKPMQVFRERLSKQQTGYIDKGMLANYRHNPDNEGSFILEDVSTMKKLEAEQLKESQLEAAVLSAPPMKVYSRPILTMAQEIVKVTEGSWSELHIVMSSLAPKAWKDGYSAATQQCILLMAMAEMTSCDTPPKVVISEAVELGKRFLDTRTAKIINECLGRFVRSEYFKQSQMKEDSVHE